MSPRRANPELADRRRDALVKAGYAEILAKGIPGTTLDSVVARAKSSKGGALYYFPTKEALLYGVLDWLLRQLNQSLDEVARAEGSARDKLAAELEVLFHSAEVNRNLYLVFFDFVALGSRRDRFRTLFSTFYATCHRRDARMVELGIREQQFRRINPDDGAATIRALVDGYCLQWLMGAEDVSIDGCRDRCRAVLGAYLLR
jgi:AcrR family transcriptional regulator